MYIIFPLLGSRYPSNNNNNNNNNNYYYYYYYYYYFILIIIITSDLFITYFYGLFYLRFYVTCLDWICSFGSTLILSIAFHVSLWRSSRLSCNLVTLYCTRIFVSLTAAGEMVGKQWVIICEGVGQSCNRLIYAVSIVLWSWEKQVYR